MAKTGKALIDEGQLLNVQFLFLRREVSWDFEFFRASQVHDFDG